MSTQRRASGLGAAIGWTTATNLALGALAMVAAPIVARGLGTEGRGRLVVVQVVPQLLADLSSVGLGFAIVHFGARRIQSARPLLRWTVRPALLGSVVMLALGQLLASTLTGGGEDERLFRWYLLICPLVAVSTAPLEVLRAAGQYRVWNALVLVRGASWPVVTLLAVTVASDPMWFIVVGHIGFRCVFAAAVWFIAWRRLDGADETPEPSSSRFVRFGMVSALSTIPRSANSKFDQIIMTAIVARGNLGLYAAAVGWSALTLPLMRALSSVTMPHVSSAREEERHERVSELYTLGLSVVLALSVGGIGLTWLLWEPLYGSQYADALVPAMVLIPAALLLEFNAVLGNVLRSLERPALVAGIETSALAVSVLALLAVLPSSEVLGPAIVSLATYGVVVVLNTWWLGRRLQVPMRTLVRPSVLLDRLLGRASSGSSEAKI